MATGNMEYGIENIGVGMEALGVLNGSLDGSA
jgi:hypothetical protein